MEKIHTAKKRFKKASEKISPSQDINHLKLSEMIKETTRLYINRQPTLAIHQRPNEREIELLQDLGFEVEHDGLLGLNITLIIPEDPKDAKIALGITTWNGLGQGTATAAQARWLIHNIEKNRDDFDNIIRKIDSNWEAYRLRVNEIDRNEMKMGFVAVFELFGYKVDAVDEWGYTKKYNIVW